MATEHGLHIHAVAWTQFATPPDIDWTTDATGGEALAEFAARSCYETWSKPNPRTDTNATFIRHLLEVGHLAALEHASVSLYLTGLSRAVTHELVRHRHFSFSERSQRHVPESGPVVVEPDAIAADPALHARFVAASETAIRAYTELLEALEAEPPAGQQTTAWRRHARQEARTILPEGLQTSLLVTGNYRAWRHFVGMRASEHPDREIRRIAVGCLRELKQCAPNVFADFEITTLPDGTEVASSPLVSEY